MKFVIVLILSLLIYGCQTQSITMDMDETESDVSAQTMEKGDRLFAAGKFKLALAQYFMLEQEADNIELQQRIAYCYQAIGNEAAAENTHLHILKLQPDHVESIQWLGVYFLQQGNSREAINYLQQAYSLGQNNWQIHNAFGLIDDLDMNYTQAREQYQLALKQVKRPENTRKILNNIGFSYYLSGDMKQALAYFNKALVIEPESRKALSNKGLVLVRLGQEMEAEYIFFRFMEKYEAYNNIGFLNMMQKKYSSAERYFKLAIRTSPVYYKEAQENLSLLRRNQME